MTHASPLLTPDEALAVAALYADYADALDEGRWADWPGFFTADGVYRLQARENHERGLPLATLALEGQGMLLDRVGAVSGTLFHHPYWQRHVVGAPRVRARHDDGRITAQASVLVVRTPRDGMPEVLVVGRYLDQLVSTPEGWRFARRELIFDNDLLPNSVIYPL
ncbi:MAG: aromatic-ring-hydroxylating dioxygenase subunit beta [Aquabacterium sp.]